MWYKEQGEVLGCLIDLDLAIRVDEMNDYTQLSRLKEQTGTTPFLALDLLAPNHPPHCYYHDLESFFYVMVWLYAKYRGGKLRRSANQWLYDWDHGSLRSMEKAKFYFMRRPKEGLDKLPRTGTYLPLYPWILSLAKMFFESDSQLDSDEAYRMFKAIIDQDPDERPTPRHIEPDIESESEEDELVSEGEETGELDV
jgi:hypothetical protein